MENYEKEPSHIEHEVEKNPFDAPQYFHIEVPKEKGAKTMANKVLKVFGPGKPVVLFAAGRATANAVGCVEIMKTYYKQPVYQVTRLGQIKTVETWDPVATGLDPLRVTRSVPMVYILISLEKVEESQIGYQESIGRRRNPRVLSMSELAATLPEDSTGPGPGPQLQPPLSPRKERPS